MGWGANTLDVDFLNRKVTVEFFNDNGITLLPVVVDIPADAPEDWYTQMVTDRVVQLDANSRAMAGITKGFVTLDKVKLDKLGIVTAKDPATVEVGVVDVIAEPPIIGGVQTP